MLQKMFGSIHHLSESFYFEKNNTGCRCNMKIIFGVFDNLDAKLLSNKIFWCWHAWSIWFCKCIFDALLANQIRLTYGDFEKYSKIYEIAMNNGNFIIFFWQILAKTCSIMVSRGVCMGMAGRGDFSRICFFFLKVYVHFLFFVEKRMRFLLLFFDVLFFCFTRVSFKKQQKKLNPHSKVK